MKRIITFAAILFIPSLLIADKNKTDSKKIKVEKPQVAIHKWRKVQKQAKDTVVQIFSMVATQNTLKPYETPEQEEYTGSGFLIDSEGHIVTNSHLIDESVGLFIQIPSLGKRRLKVHLVSICPERDLALLKVDDEGITLIKKTIKKVPFLSLGNSDDIYRSDEVIALGYPLGEESVKSTSGVISGKERGKIQTSAPVNTGNSGGPLLNIYGKVIGINTETVQNAENVGYAITINEFKLIHPEMKKIKLVRKPILGVYYSNSTDSLIDFLKNPQPGGCYITDILKDGLLDEAGIKNGDILYQINGNKINIYGELLVPWSEEKISLDEYISRLKIGDKTKVIVYRNGKRVEVAIEIKTPKLIGVRTMYPGYEKIDYEIFAGMVVMQLSKNHVKSLSKNSPGLYKYNKAKNRHQNILVITHIFGSSSLEISRTLKQGFTLKEINNKKVETLDDFRKAVLAGAKSDFFVVKATDNGENGTGQILVSLPLDKIITQEHTLSKQYKYPISSLVKKIEKQKNNQK